MRYILRIINMALAITLALAIAACTDGDTYYNTFHPDQGALVVTADFSSRSAEASVPANYFIALSSGEGWGEACEVAGTTNVYPKLLDPQTYTLLVYNQPEGITVSGTTATVNSVQTKSRADGYVIEANPDYLFGSYSQVNIVKDDTTRVTVKMKQYVKLLNIKLKIKEGDADNISSVVCTLGGIATSIDLATGAIGTTSAYVISNMQVGDGTITADLKVLGVVTDDDQNLSVKITYKNGDEETVDSDISDIIGNINNDDTTTDDGTTPSVDISGDIELPTAAGATATITNWTVGNGNGEDFSIK